MSKHSLKGYNDVALKAVILGCGNSTGVPAIGNRWGDCDPNEPKNQRTRCGFYIESASTRILIDTPPELRLQMNREGINSVDAVFSTHAHGDHSHGIDDLRLLSFSKNERIPYYADAATMAEQRDKFGYLFDGGKAAIYKPILEPCVLKDEEMGRCQRFGDIDFIPFFQDHTTCQSVGYRFGEIAYSVDFKSLDDQAVDVLKGVKIWVADGAAYKKHDNTVHADLRTLYELNERIGAQQVYITSLALNMNYQTLLRELPEGFFPAYDGLKFP